MSRFRTESSMKPQPVAPALAYSYIRFSSPEQAKGDSLRRQTQGAEDWCERWCARHGPGAVKLDTSVTLHDLGTSAFLGEHRKNPDRNALAAFLKLVEQGRVARGSFLVLENLDRLSREHIRPALTLLLQLIEAGVAVVQLIPVEVVYDDHVEPMQLMMAIMELARGHSESAVKSERVGAAWADKKRRARSGGHIITHKLPAWVRDVGGRLELVPAAAAAVRRVFELARDGYGHHAVAKRLAQESVAPIGRSGAWSRSYVGKLLSDRRAVGEFQPRKRDGSTDGDPIPNYFPAVVTNEDWYAARAGATTRRKPGTTITPAGAGPNNMFAGLIWSARGDGTYYAAQRVDGHRPGRKGGRRQWVLVNTASAEARTKCYSFPLDPFERAVLKRLPEIRAADVLSAPAPNRSAAIAGEREHVEAQIRSLEAELRTGDVPSLARALRSLEARAAELRAEEEAERVRAAAPLEAAWVEAIDLSAALAEAKDPAHARTRLRSLLRRIFARITLLVVPRGRSRVAAVRFDFQGGIAHRDYLIHYRPPHSNGVKAQPPVLDVVSLKWGGGALDLRSAEHVEQVEAYLKDLDLAQMAQPQGTVP